MNRLYFHGWEPDATSEEGVAANGVNGNASSVGKGLRPVPVFSFPVTVVCVYDVLGLGVRVDGLCLNACPGLRLIGWYYSGQGKRSQAICQYIRGSLGSVATIESSQATTALQPEMSPLPNFFIDRFS